MPAAEAPQNAAPPSKISTALRRLGWLVLALLLLMGVAWLGVPPLLKSQVEKHASEALGRPVRIGRIDFKPWTLELTAEQLSVGAAPGAASSEPLLKIARLHANADLRSVLNLAPVLTALEVDQPELRVARTAPGHYDIDDLIARFGNPAPARPDDKPARFALYNVQLRGGSVHVDDQPLQRQHDLKGLTLALPFLSNLPSQVNIEVTPRLAFELGGTAFDTQAQARPFSSSHTTKAQFRLATFDLEPWLGYWPEALPVQLKRGRITADVAVNFNAPPRQAPSLSLTGKVGTQDVALTDRHGTRLLDWAELDVALRDVQPLARRVGLGAVTLDGLVLDLSRDAQGRLNLQTLDAPAEGTAPGIPAARAATAASAPADTPSQPWQVSVEAVALQNTRLNWHDEGTHPAADLALDALNVETGAVQWPLRTPVTFKLSSRVRTSEPPTNAGTGPDGAAPPPAGRPGATIEAGQLSVEGRASDRAARLTVQLDKLGLAALTPYLNDVLVPGLSGTLTAQGQLDWAAPGEHPASEPGQFKLALRQTTLDEVKLIDRPAPPTAAAAASASVTAASAGSSAPARAARVLAMAAALPPPPPKAAVQTGPLATLSRLQADDIALDLNARSATLGKVVLTQPDTRLARDAAGQWNVTQWLVPAPPEPATPAAAKASASTPPHKPPPPWHIELKEVQLQNGHLRYADALAGGPSAPPVQLDIGQLALNVQGVAFTGDKLLAPVPWKLSGNVTGGGDRPAASAAAARTLDGHGDLTLQPLRVQGDVKIRGFPVHALEPYFGERIGLSVPRASLGYQGVLGVQDGPAGLAIVMRGDGRLGDVRVNTRKGGSNEELLSWQALTLQGLDVNVRPPQKPQVTVRELALSDFYSKLVITEEGRFNLQDVGSAPPAGAGAASAPAPAASTTPPAAPGTDLPVDVTITATRLSNGRVDFTDRFIRPSYSADLSELQGTLGTFRTSSRDMATLALRGKVARTGTLDISGQVNPTARPMAMDLHARAADLELTPLSPYAGKYAGYGIERGKLTMDVAYRITPDGKLDASNRLVLNQLTFGDRVESPSATQLPVLLAVALLKDRHGVIDLDMPISGSINDPQFSMFGLVMKVIGNVLTKAVTAPFSLLSGGHGEDLSVVTFEPGTSVLTAEGRSTVDKVAKALNDRPALRLTLTGQVDGRIELGAWQAASVEQRVQALGRREREQDSPEPLTPAERSRALKALYQQNLKAAAGTKPPPRASGDASDAEMLAALTAAATATSETWRDLAMQRGEAVRDALIAKEVANARLFLASPRVLSGNGATSDWKPRADLSLSAQ